MCPYTVNVFFGGAFACPQRSLKARLREIGFRGVLVHCIPYGVLYPFLSEMTTLQAWYPTALWVLLQEMCTCSRIYNM